MIVYIDMDGVIADFRKSSYFKLKDPVASAPPRMYEQGFFETLPVADGASWALRSILKNKNLDVYILTQPVKESTLSYTEKANWIAKWFPELSGKIIMTQNKELLAAEGRILIDDADWKWQALWENNQGTFFHFNVNSYDPIHPTQSDIDSFRSMWEIIVSKLKDWEPSQGIPKL